MKVSELANELGTTSKEILEIIKQKDPAAKMFAASKVTDAQEAAVRGALSGKKGGEAKAETPKAPEAKAEGPKAAEPKTEAAGSGAASAQAAPKKKLTAVFRPQNAQQQIKRPMPKPAPAPCRPPPPQPAPPPPAQEHSRKQASVQKTEAPQKPETAQKGENTQMTESVQKPDAGRRPENTQRTEFAQKARTASPAAEGERSQAGRDGGSRDGRDGNRQGGYQGSRDGRDGNRGGYQGSRDGRDGNRQGGYQGSRDGNRGGYQGSRDGRDGNRQGGYQGSRDGNRQGGYQGSRDGRDGNRQGGYQGSRDGNRQGGYQGSRDGSRPGGFGQNRFGGGRDGGDKDRDTRENRGGRDSGRRPGGRDGAKVSFDTPIQAKPTSNRQNKNAHKNDRFDKRDHEEEAKGKGGRSAKTGKGAFIMPQPKKEEAKVEDIKTIVLPETLTIRELAEKMKLQPSVIVKKLFMKGQMVTLNQEIDYEKAEEIALEFDVLCEKEEKVDVIAELLKEDEESPEDMVPRPPVVCVMGHVDHGKTSLLDAIRQTNVTAREAGGITQHIGASVIEINGRKITFLDTPGHEAFTAMRMRGAQSTDIAILVVAADDGVMPQTIEAINHAKAAGVEIIVAINKIDKPSANVEKVKQELAEYELIPEDWGGSTIFVPVSAHTKEGITDLLEMVLLTADVMELKANPNRKGRGLVIEAELDKGKGPVATVLVQKGTLRVGETIAAGACYGKIRAMMDDKGRRVKEAGPSMPVEILGLNDVPQAGEVFVATENEKEARNFAETFISESKNKLIEETKSKLSLDDLFSQIKAGNVKELPLIVKADVQGSVEAVRQSLTKLSNEEVVVKVIHGGVGAINESDVTLASASNAIIIGFNVRPDATAKSVAEREKVDIRLYKVIYQAIEDVEAAMKGMLDPIFEEKIIGHGVVRQLFKASGVGTIAGSYVLDGKFIRGCKCRVSRGGEQIFDGSLASLKRFKDDVKEVAAGYECGLVFEKFNDLAEDDEIEAYMMVEVPR